MNTLTKIIALFLAAAVLLGSSWAFRLTGEDIKLGKMWFRLAISSYAEPLPKLAPTQ